ncbi:MAG: hypothetical protein M1820_008144 [Bogoriella megaspora]|nr:MAG: hypothetical protein M1820_008144 [Bogoriella megaspora]
MSNHSFKINVKLRSQSKAERNDPRPAGYRRERLEQLDLETLNDTSEDARQMTTLPLSVDGDDDSTYPSEDDEFVEFEWLEQIDGKILLVESDVEKDQQIGYCNCKLIRRDRITDFYDDMEEPTEETSSLAFELFDRYGRLQKEIKQHKLKKGTGIWQDELDQGDLLLFKSLQVSKPYRRQGQGRELVVALLEKARQKSTTFFAVACPAGLTREVEKEVEGLTKEEAHVVSEREDKAAEAFFRALGFRRVGATPWFALASDEQHPCHGLSAEEDFDLPPVPVSTTHPGLEALLEESLTMNGDDWSENIMAILSNLPSDDDPRWQARNHEGNTVLHVAAIRGQQGVVEWIIDRNSQLQNISNRRGETPVETLEVRLESQRVKSGSKYLFKVHHLSDMFKGFNKESVQCLMKLRGLVNTTQLDVERLTFGCTCGQCTKGFLSPRMRHALLCQAQIQYDKLSEDVYSVDGESFVIFNEYLLNFLEPAVRANLATNKSMRRGFVNLCNHFVTALKWNNDTGIPSRVNVLHAAECASEWPPATLNYLQRGGTAYAVGSMVFNRAMEQDRWAGDGEHYEIFKNDIDQLPECRNDHEFGFVSGMCGYRRVSNVRLIDMQGNEIYPEYVSGPV